MEEDKQLVFLRWLEDNGAQISPQIRLVSTSKTERGVHALETIPSHTTIISIPLKCLITDDMGRNQTINGPILFNQPNKLSAPTLIAVVIFILEHLRQGKDSFFKPYLDLLPTDCSNFPVFWSEAQRNSWLAGSPLIEDIQERYHTMEQDFEEICRRCHSTFDFSFNEFLHVRTLVGSRNFGIIVNGQKRTSMVPFADMLNHLRPRQTSWTFDNRKQHFTVTSIDCVQGEVMDSYGKKDNSRFLLHYGFAVWGNREEDGKCPNEVQVEVVGHAKKRSMQFKISMHREEKGTLEALAFARMLCAKEEDLLDAGLHLQPHAFSISRFLNAENEMCALQLLASACQTQLEKYPHTFKQNVEALQKRSSDFGAAERAALIVIVGEQEICSYWLFAVNCLVEGLRTKDFSKIVKQRETDISPPEVWGEHYWRIDVEKHATWLINTLHDVALKI